MVNPLAQIKLFADELGKDAGAGDPARLNVVEALLVKFLFAFVLVFCVYVYLDKTSVLNGNTPEENQRLHKMDYKKQLQEAAEKERAEDREKEERKKEEDKAGGKSSGVGAKSSGAKSRKT